MNAKNAFDEKGQKGESAKWQKKKLKYVPTVIFLKIFLKFFSNISKYMATVNYF